MNSISQVKKGTGKMKKRLIPVICGILTAFAVGTVNADDVLSKEEIADRLWEDMWFGNADDGTVFPEASYKHHLLTEWIDENYSNNEDYDWSNIGRIGYQYSDYYSDLTENWLFTDENDQWYITDEETGMVYHFSMFQGHFQFMSLIQTEEQLSILILKVMREPQLRFIRTLLSST